MGLSILSTLIYLVSTTCATPILSFPFNSQLPPVAQWNHAYSYELSPDTYRSDDGAISYSSTDLPSWLSINGRTLSGTPSGGSGDSTISFQLTASDSTGNTSSSCTLQITDSALPTYSNSALEEVLKESGPVANANSAVLVPDQEFEITFPPSFFSSEGNVIGHYAVTGEHSPLPIWLNFDGSTGTFSGTAPSVNSKIAQAQQFSVVYIVSTFAGFESAGAEFNLLLGANVLSMNISTDRVNATAGRDFTYSVPLNEITLDGHPVTSANLSSAKATIPNDAQSWLNWDTDSFKLSGTPPESAAGIEYIVGIDIVDTFNDAVSWDVAIAVTSANNVTVFTESSLPPANVTRGKWFQYDLGSYILNKDIDLKVSSNADWISVNSGNLTLTGMVPRNFDKASLNISATLKSGSSQQKRDASKASSTALTNAQEKSSSSLTARLELYGVGPMISSSMSSSSSMSRTTSHSHSSKSSYRSISSASATISSGATRGTSTSTSSPTASFSPIKKNNNSNNHAVAIGCGVGIPVGLIAIAAIIALVFCCRRRRRNEKSIDGGAGGAEDRAVGMDDSNISAPRPTSKGFEMAPVFRSNSHSSDEFVDAVQYPGELPGGDEKTVYETLEKEKMDELSIDSSDSLEAPRQPWDSPRHASTANFVAMDDESNTFKAPNQFSDQETIASLSAQTPPGFQGTLAHDVPPHDEEDDVLGDIPRESWRHTNTGERRWQDARLSQSSLASIVPTEPPTVLLAQGEFAENMAQSQALHQRLLAEQETQHNDTAVGATTSLTSDQINGPGFQREYSSGVIHRVGSHSSSIYSGSCRDSRAISERIGEHYRSGSSTDSNNSQDLSDDSGAANFRPYRDENGELHWREDTSNDIVGETKLNNVGLDRKPSAAKTPTGDQGEFVFV